MITELKPFLSAKKSPKNKDMEKNQMQSGFMVVKPTADCKGFSYWSTARES